MEKRSFDRITARQFAMYLRGKLLCPATVTDLSPNGMCLKAQLNYPVNSIFDLHIPLQKDIIEVTVQVARLVQNEHVYEGMGVELIKPTRMYLDFIDTLAFPQDLPGPLQL